MPTLFDRLAALPLAVDGYVLERLHGGTSRMQRDVHVLHVTGGGAEGLGEDISYAMPDQDALAALAPLPLTGSGTLGDALARLDASDWYPTEPAQHGARDFRRWAFESALLDLALRQAGRSLGDVLGLPYRPVRFVVSSAQVEGWLAVQPSLEFKLDAENSWDDARVAALAALGRVVAVDYKGHYVGDWLEPLDPGVYPRVARAFPEAVLEDPSLEPAYVAALEGFEERRAWDAPVHSLADVHGLPATRHLNIKPSRFGRISELLATIEHCQREGIAMYGGGQWELGPGRAHIQSIASLFYADGPNDVAPIGYNAPAPYAGLPTSPLPAPAEPAGFGYEWVR